MKLRSAGVKQRDRAFMGRSSEPEAIQIVRTQGSTVVDARGRKYVDFVAGWCVGNLGWGRREIRARLRRFRGPDYVGPDYLYEPWTELAELLAELTPGRLKRSFRATGGTEAVEIALQAAILYTGRHKFLSLEESYHGNSLAALGVAASSSREKLAGLFPGNARVSPPLDGNAVDRVETVLKRRETAAFIMEPVAMNLGVLVPTPEFMEGVTELCRKHGTLFIADEVACGFGRTGALFASEHYHLEPDIMCLAKAITGGYAALGATVMTDKVFKKVKDDLRTWSTFGWHPLSVEAAIANLRYLKRHRGPLLRHVAERSAQFETRLRAMEFARPAQIRVKGLAIAVELEDGDDYAEEIVEKCRKNGLLLSNDDDLLQLFPPLTIDRATTQRGLDILEDSL